MAVTEVIHFPLWTQLGLRLLLPDQILFEPVSLFPPNLLPKCGCPLARAECLWLSVRSGGS
jgi:hypothetical protein